ncbi:uncharacterized protein METZ01_LOCUS108504 [marine metagenome]|uniref:Uncharacterized protein n=1 Tax=marine metagenome TaxID=408172 RepID=A0A381WT51_9ZZZZ
MKIKDIKNKISGTAIAAVIAIVALLIITVDLKNKKDKAVALLANAEVGISTVEAEYLDSISRLEGTIQAYELEIASIRDVLQSTNNELSVFQAELSTAEAVATQLADQLVTANATIVDLTENPNCPVQ